MSSIEFRLAVIGFRAERRAPECWRVERAGPGRRRLANARSEPACSLTLPLWLDRLHDRQRPAIYRIRRSAVGD